MLMAILSGCATDKQRAEETNKLMASWVGSHQSDLIAKWGPPSRTASDGNGGSILIYEAMGQIPGQVYRVPFGGLNYTAPQQVARWSRMFYVNPQGVIYRWRWQGL